MYLEATGPKNLGVAVADGVKHELPVRLPLEGERQDFAIARSALLRGGCFACMVEHGLAVLALGKRVTLSHRGALVAHAQKVGGWS